MSSRLTYIEEDQPQAAVATNDKVTVARLVGPQHPGQLLAHNRTPNVGDLAVKVLTGTGVSPYAGFNWPKPVGGQPGKWVTYAGTIVPCDAGLHFTTLRDVDHWFGADRTLWLVECDPTKQLVYDNNKWVTSRLRLVREVPVKRTDLHWLIGEALRMYTSRKGATPTMQSSGLLVAIQHRDAAELYRDGSLSGLLFSKLVNHVKTAGNDTERQLVGLLSAREPIFGVAGLVRLGIANGYESQVRELIVRLGRRILGL